MKIPLVTRQEAKNRTKIYINEKSSAGHWIQKMREKSKPNIKPHIFALANMASRQT